MYSLYTQRIHLKCIQETRWIQQQNNDGDINAADDEAVKSISLYTMYFYDKYNIV